MNRFRLAAVFSDHCVLQRFKPISIFGEGKDGTQVSVTLAEDGAILRSAAAKVENGKWRAVLCPAQAHEGLTLTAACGDVVIRYQDVAVGEVWLCGGQSNMEFELQNCSTGKQHLENDRPNVRFYYTQKKMMSEPDFFETEAHTGWTLFSPENARCWSAVGYLFAEKLSKALGVTVGLIGCNWGGTSASCWMDEEALGEDPDTASYLRDYEKGIEGKSIEQQTEEYRTYKAYADEWDRKYTELIKENPGMGWLEAEAILGHNRWPGPINYLSPFKPCALYRSMLMRVCPYTLRGFLFYQGESDDHKPQMYLKLFTRMIRSWREAWGEDVPFLYVQLPGHRYMNSPDCKNWCLIREAQEQVSRTVRDACMICAIDAGELNEIHPKNKEPIGERLFRKAMEKVYGHLDTAEAESPFMESVRFEGSAASVRFACACDGLTVKGGGEIAGFELAGDGLVYRPAQAALLEDRRTVRLQAEGIEKPAFVRYLWANFPMEVNLYGTNGLPVLPFRTDNAEGGRNQQGIQQIMEL